MANTIVNLCGFETGSNLEMNSQAGTFAVTNAKSRSGTYSLETNPVGVATGFGSLLKPSPSTGVGAAIAINTIFFSWYMNIATVPAASEAIIQVSTGTAGAAKLYVYLNSNSTLSVYDSTNTIVATGSTVLASNTWVRIDLQAGNGLTAAYTLQVNGSVELSGTCNQAATSVGNIHFGKVTNTNGSSLDIYWDDFWIDSTAFAPANYNIIVDIPTANGTTMSWTGGTAPSDYTQINSIPNTTSKTVVDAASASTPVIAEFAMQTYAQMGIPVGSTIYGLKSITSAKSATTDSYQSGVISGGVTGLTTGGSLTVGFGGYHHIVQTDPNTSANWTQSGVENVQLYLVENTASVTTTAAAALLMIAYLPAASTTRQTLTLTGVGS